MKPLSFSEVWDLSKEVLNSIIIVKLDNWYEPSFGDACSASLTCSIGTPDGESFIAFCYYEPELFYSRDYNSTWVAYDKNI